MEADMETMKCQIKGKAAAEEEVGKSRAYPRHSEDRDRQDALSHTENRSLRTYDTQSRTLRTRYSMSERTRTERSYTEGSSYRPLHSHQTTSRHTELPRLADLQTVLEKSAQKKEDTQARDPRKVSTLQWLAPRTHGSIDVGMPEPRLAYEPADKMLARLQSSLFVPTIENALLPSGFHQPKFTTYEGKSEP
ncbi:hypothetical protein CsSME_00034378 [Camellia sinensis var. sinensis]